MDENDSWCLELGRELGLLSRIGTNLNVFDTVVMRKELNHVQNILSKIWSLL